MHTAVVIAIGVVVAAMIGGVTNYLAIRMLFRPRRARYIGAWRIPFTPGLIPKRRDEIAASLGRVVAGYLVTSEALTELFASSRFADRLAGQWAAAFRKFVAEDAPGLTLRELAEGWIPGGLTEERLAVISGKLDDWFREGFVAIWNGTDLADKPLSALLPDWTPEKREVWASTCARIAAETLAQTLASPEGEQLIVRLTKQLVDQAGGFLGTMAGLFLDEYKVAAKVRMALLEALSGETAWHALVQFFNDQLAKAENKTPREVLSLFGLPADDADALAKRLGRQLRWEEWMLGAGDWQPGPWLLEHAERIEAMMPRAANFVLQVAASRADRLFQAIRLEEIVERQVRDFPIERLEEIIVNISGREFRAITWLGALLGGIIGLVQGMLLHLVV